jgi:mannose-6-phosphate isomerase-like protein (cupin superfamily)
VAAILEGGCRVTAMREGSPTTNGTLRIWNQVGLATGAEAISLRVMQFGNGFSPGLRNPQADEVLYMPEATDSEANASSCSVQIDGQRFDVEPQTGIYVRPGQIFALDNPGPEKVVFISSRCPQTSEPEEFVAPVPEGTALVLGEPPLVRLSDRRALPTADRWYRVLVDKEVGSEQVTQFVGSIPPGRAPDHFHQYEEVLFILRGKGRMWAGKTSAPIGVGSCIYLPRGQVHCVENTGEDELRLLGVFYPAGSPAVRYQRGTGALNLRTIPGFAKAERSQNNQGSKAKVVCPKS